MLGILEDAPYVCLLYMGTAGTRKAQRSSRDVFHSGTQKTRLPLSVGSLRATRCPRPMEDNGADPEAVASLPSAGAAGDPTPQSRCSSRELCGSRCFLPSLRFKIVLGAWKVSINFPHGLLVGWGGPGLARAALAVLLSGSAASAEPAPCCSTRRRLQEPWVAWVAGKCARLVPSPGYQRWFFNFSMGGENLRATPAWARQCAGRRGCPPAPVPWKVGVEQICQLLTCFPWGILGGFPGDPQAPAAPAPSGSQPHNLASQPELDTISARGDAHPPRSAAPSLRLQRRTLPTWPFLDLLRVQTTDGAARVLKPGSPHPRLAFIFHTAQKAFP
ncbi:uncharacterized protein LOC121232634 [Aquila chrysaetos chrysaetos]|uniref:uncharacterized protein LOC121232634 n=1 Tax=Aquila chrysaetos chrysaetos TaxID=223781 RepID=UPI001B7D3C63|nr:uncharacterized protein LOC121232634 [Aquila chrysaetos chrysaetos]